MTAEEKDQEWRNQLACYGYDVTGTVDEVVRKMAQEWQKIDWRWREQIERHLPQLGFMSFAGPECTIRWLMERVEIKPEYKELADQLIAIEASELSDEDKSEARLKATFPNLGPRIK